MKENRNRIFVVTVMVVLLLIGGGCVVLYGRNTKKTGHIRKMGQRSGKPSVVKEISETPIPSAASWSIARQSGRKEDFEAYFKRDLDAYTKERSTPKGKMKKIHYYSRVIGEKREVYVYTPPQYSKDKKYLVLYLLHGIGCDGSQWISMKADNVLDNMIADGECVPCVVVCPSITPKKNKRTTQAISPENIEAYEKFDRELTEDLIPFINSHYNVSDKRKDTAIAGLSMGGMESLLVGLSHLDLFNYIGSFSAAPSLDTFLMKFKNHSIKPKLLLLCSGTSDSTVGDIPEGYHNILAENRVDHIWYLYPDGGHSYEVWLSGLINFLQRMKDDFLRFGKIESRFVSVAVNNMPRAIDLLHMTYAQQSIIGSGGYMPEDVRDVQEIMASGKWNLEHIITHEFPLVELDRAIRTASDIDHAGNVIVEMKG